MYGFCNLTLLMYSRMYGYIAMLPEPTKVSSTAVSARHAQNGHNFNAFFAKSQCLNTLEKRLSLGNYVLGNPLRYPEHTDPWLAIVYKGQMLGSPIALNCNRFSFLDDIFL